MSNHTRTNTVLKAAPEIDWTGIVSGPRQNIIKRHTSSQRVRLNRIELQLVINVYIMHVVVRTVLRMTLCGCGLDFASRPVKDRSLKVR